MTTPTSLPREIVTRILTAPFIFLGLIILAFLGAGFVLFGRTQRRKEIARGMSRTLNGCMDGTGDVTFSAQSYQAMLLGKRFGAERVRLVDAIPGNGSGHCRDGWLFHVEHGLIKPPPSS